MWVLKVSAYSLWHSYTKEERNCGPVLVVCAPTSTCWLTRNSYLCSFEEGSPGTKRKKGSKAKPLAPYRMSLRDDEDNLLVSYRGLPLEVRLFYCLTP